MANPVLNGRILAQDTFTRADQSGWGTASDGRTWTQVTGTETLSIVSNKGSSVGATGASIDLLGSDIVHDAEALIKVNFPLSNDAPALLLRYQPNGTYYKLQRDNGTLTIVWSSSITLATITFTDSVNTDYWMRFRVEGGYLSGKMWDASKDEPGYWMITAADTTITAPGQYGIRTFGRLTTDAYLVDSYTVTDGDMHLPRPRYTGRALGSAIIPDVVKQPLPYATRALGSTLIYENRTFVPRAFGGIYMPDTVMWVPRAVVGTEQFALLRSLTLTGVGTLSGTLSVSGGVSLTAECDGVGTLSGTLSLATALVDTLPGIGTLTGTLSANLALSTLTMAGSGSLKGSLFAVSQPLPYIGRALGSTIVYEQRTFVPRALGAVYIPDTILPVPRGLLSTIQAKVGLGCTMAGAGTLAPVLAHVYYVAPTGNDSNPGSLASPWLTLAHVAANVIAGDTVIFEDGTYLGNVTLTTAGTAAAPITLKSQNKWGAQLTQDGVHTGVGAYVLALQGDYTSLDGFEITGPDVQLGVSIECLFGTVKSCWVHDTCNFDPGSAGGAGIRNARNANTDYVGYGTSISNNRVERIGPKSGGLIVANSFVHGLYVQVDATTALASAYNNLVINCSGGGIVMYHNPNNWMVSNNTIIYCRHVGITCWGDTGSGFSADHNTIQNNIIVECGGAISYQAIWSQSDSCGSHNVFRTNLAYFSGQTPIYDNTTHAVNPPQDMTSLELANADPLFVNYVNDGTGDYHLTSSSSAKDTGTTTGAPTIDYDGQTRPQGSAYDVGAYEFVYELAGILAGVGTLAGPLALSTVLTNTLAGIGTLTGTISLKTALSTTLVGVGTLTGTLSTTGGVSLAVTMAGVGTLTGTTTLTTALSTTLAGVGTLTGTLSANLTLPSTSLVGVGTLAGTMALSTALAQTFVGAGTLSGVFTIRVALSLTFAGMGTLAGAITIPSLSFLSAVWTTRDMQAVWKTRDDLAAWATRDEVATWGSRDTTRS